MTLLVWDGRPQYVEFRGQTIEVFTRTALAKALNREFATVCSLERKGILIHPRIRDGRGRWLYTRAQILALVNLAEEEGVIDPRYRRTFSPRFIEQAHLILSQLPS